MCGAPYRSLARKSTGGGAQTHDVLTRLEPPDLIAFDDSHSAGAHRSPPSVVPHRSASLVDAEQRQLLKLEAELTEPLLGVGHGAIRSLPRRRRRHDVGGPGAGGRGEDAVLFFVARVELVPSRQREHSRHVPSIWRCPKLKPFACASRRARPGSRTWAPPRPRCTTCCSHASARASSRCASTTRTSSATGPSTSS